MPAYKIQSRAYEGAALLYLVSLPKLGEGPLLCISPLLEENAITGFLTVIFQLTTSAVPPKVLRLLNSSQSPGSVLTSRDPEHYYFRPCLKGGSLLSFVYARGYNHL